MRSTTMRGLVLAASMLAGSAHATATFDTTFSCGQTLALNTTASGLSISCQGGLSLSGGSVVADEALSFSSDTAITVIDVLIQGTALTFTAPLVDLQGTTALSGDTIGIHSNVVGTVPTPPTVGGEVLLSPGAVVSIGQPSSPSIDLRVQGTPTSPTSVSLQQGGTIVLQNSAGVQFTLDGQINPSQWGSGAPTVQLSVVPEPGTWALMAAGMATLLLTRRRLG
ncbi:MAG TPA: PEP-CTERM sorting domain-containing protein [Candidatus Aquabacterium excrementipullorum]|nr:PEP-CTERM sorting domain-containing protein [Candidatus Aquabacterium excrementipullorum]